MGAGRTIARGTVRVNIDDAGFRAKLKEDEAVFHKTMRKIDADEARPTVELDKSDFEAAIKEVHKDMAKVERLRAKAIVEADTKGIEKANAELTMLKAKAERLDGQKVRLDVGVDQPTMSKGIMMLSRWNDRIQDANTHISQFGGSILNAGFRLGPLTLRLKTVVGVMTVLAPVVTSLGGSLSALAGVTLAGLTGALVVGGAGLAAFATGIAGVSAVAIPLVKDLNAAMTASKAYDKAVQQYGKHSKQAATAQEKLKSVIGNVGPGTAHALASIQGLGREWSKLTKGAKPAFFNLIADGVKTIKSIMPGFAKDSVSAFKTVSTGLRGMLKGLRGPEFKNIMHSFFEGFEKSFPNILHMLGSLATAFGRIFQAAMPMWVEFTGWLDKVVSGFADSTKNSSGLKNTLQGLGDAAASVGKFLISATRLAASFFLAGSDAGKGLLDTLTGIFDKWTDWINSAKGQQSLGAFFKDAVSFASKLFAIVGQLTSIFVELGVALTPIASAIADIVLAMTKMGVLKPVIMGLMAAFAATKIIALAAMFGRAAAGVRTFVAALMAAKAAQAALNAVGLSGIAATFAGGAGGKAGAGRLGATVAAEAAAAAAGAAAADKLTAANNRAAVAAERAGGKILAQKAAVEGGAVAMGTLAAHIPAVAVAAAAFTAGFVGMTAWINAWKGGMTDAEKASQAVTKAWQAEGQATKTLSNNLGGLSNMYLPHIQSSQRLAAAKRQVNALTRQGALDTQRGRIAIQELDAAEQEHIRIEKSRVTAAQNVRNAARKTLEAAYAGADAARKLMAGDKQRVQAMAEVRRAEQFSYLSMVNLARAQRGLTSIPWEQQGQKLGAFLQKFKQVSGIGKVKKLVISADISQANAAIRILGRYQAMGAGKKAISIIANSSSLEEALGKLRRLEAQTKRKYQARIEAKNNTGQAAIQALRSLEKVDKTFLARLNAKNAVSGPASVARNAAQALVRTFMATLAANNQASGTIAGLIAQGLAWAGRVFTATFAVNKKGGNAEGGPSMKIHDEPGRASARGAKVSRPTFLVGEENRPEFVIATNPAYREANVNYLHQAADALGVEMFAKGKGNKKKARERKRYKKAQKRLSRKGIKWAKDLAAFKGPVSETESRIKLAEERREQDERMYNIQDGRLDFNNEDGSVNQGAIQQRANHLTDLIRQTQAITNLYRKLKGQLEDAMKAIPNLMNDYNREAKRIDHLKGVSKSHKNNLKGKIRDRIEDLNRTKSDIAERLGEVGSEDRGLIRERKLDEQEYSAEQSDVLATKAQNTGSNTPGDNPDLQAQLDQAKLNAYNASRAQGIAEAALSAFTGFGDIGTGGFGSAFSAALGNAVTAGVGASNAFRYGGLNPQTHGPSVDAGGVVGGSGGNTIVVNTLHPGDPATLDAIGRAATGGIGLQGLQSSPRTRLGI